MRGALFFLAFLYLLRVLLVSPLKVTLFFDKRLSKPHACFSFNSICPCLWNILNWNHLCFFFFGLFLDILNCSINIVYVFVIFNMRFWRLTIQLNHLISIFYCIFVIQISLCLYREYYYTNNPIDVLELFILWFIATRCIFNDFDKNAFYINLSEDGWKNKKKFTL